MCLIVDTNCAARCLGESIDPNFRAVLDCITSGNLCLYYGGTKLVSEYSRIEAVRRRIVALDRAGRAMQLSKAMVDAEERALIESGACQSDDQHVLAVARLSGAKLLVSNDTALHADFKNQTLVGRGGRIYQDAAHINLLPRACR